MLTLVVFLLILSILVLIHEAGHFFVAKKFGIKVEEFGFGLPPRIWGKKIGETIYSINWLPIGGFVKLFGEDEAGGGKISLKGVKTEKKELNRAFFARSVWQRGLVVVAGVVMNALLAVLIYYVFLAASGFKVELPLLDGYRSFFLVNQQVRSDIIISSVAKHSPASQANIPLGVKVIAINGKPVIDSDSFRATIKQLQGQQISLTWQDLQTNRTATVQITPRANPPKGEGALGVGFFPLSTIVLSYDSPLQKAFSGFIHPANLMAYTVVELKTIIDKSIKAKNIAPLSQNVSGPVGIYSLVGTIVHIPDLKERILQTLNLAGLLSMSLAFFNMLPIPGLDGGRFFFIVVEAVTRKKLNPTVEGWIHTVGMIVLIGLIILVTIKDIGQFFR